MHGFVLLLINVPPVRGLFASRVHAFVLLLIHVPCAVFSGPNASVLPPPLATVVLARVTLFVCRGRSCFVRGYDCDAMRLAFLGQNPAKRARAATGVA